MAFQNPIISVAQWLQLRAPRNGDALNNQNFEPEFHRIADRDRYLHRLVAPSTVYMSISHGSTPITSGNGTWEFNTGYQSFVSGGTNPGAGAGALTLGLSDLPAYCSLTELRLSITGLGTYTGTPQNRLRMQLESRSASENGASLTTVASATDAATYGGTPDMNAVRDVVMNLGAGGTLIDKTSKSYSIRIITEYGTYAQTGVVLLRLRATILQPGD
jgi:hypothetical protein